MSQFNLLNRTFVLDTGFGGKSWIGGDTVNNSCIPHFFDLFGISAIYKEFHLCSSKIGIKSFMTFTFYQQWQARA
ncbi:hypothetical protein A2696_00270 [Candidatus Curtissbacteria bacterium RIFCSPHIGHO2_01_FULL_41_13]|uniref:Uncharacterized protein n=1 Tax=Candidatus Curtissbacteria bacterium RIFCSPHIGHO2_01_FULL_41_13 TaxID=1797745 RepID=A0A1F5FZW2_9BACT|nr:MAG: hypothetical protein A2696_00270 [Candidatus Curtissbacteria bacterium RIFCSPHIGHO2_01_FULL_41_13]